MKNIIKSIRMTADQANFIQENADWNHLSFNEFVLISAMRGKEQFTPVQCVHIQDILNIAHNLAEQYAPDILPEIEEKERMIWSL